MIIHKKILTATVLGLALSTTPMMGVHASPSTHESAIKESVHDVRTQLSELADNIGDYSEDKREQLEAAIEDALEKVDHQLDMMEADLRANWANMSESARESKSHMMSNLREKRNAIGEEYGALKSNSKDLWSELKENFRETLEDFKDYWNETFETASLTQQ